MTSTAIRFANMTSPVAADTPEKPVLVGVKDFEPVTGVRYHPSHMVRLAHEGKIPPFVRIGNRPFWRRDELIAWAKSFPLETR
jgi:hypothetical protein